MKKPLSLIVFLSILVGSGIGVYAAIQSAGTVTKADGYEWPDAEPVTNPETHDLRIGYVDENKRIVGSTEVFISRLPVSTYRVAYNEVTVNRQGYDGQDKQIIVGESLVFVDKNKTSDNGWAMADATKKEGKESEAEKWVKVFNGNPAYVFDSTRSNIYSYTITNPETGESYQAYNIADLAEASGGKGVDFGLKPLGQSAAKSLTTSGSSSPGLSKYDGFVLILKGVGDDKALPVVIMRSNKVVYNIKLNKDGTFEKHRRFGELISTNKGEAYIRPDSQSDIKIELSNNQSIVREVQEKGVSGRFAVMASIRR